MDKKVVPTLKRFGKKDVEKAERQIDTTQKIKKAKQNADKLKKQILENQR